MPNDGQSLSGRYSDCYKAIMPLVISALRSSPSGICDLDTVLEEILPTAEADGWEKDEVISVLQLLGKTSSECAKDIILPVPPIDR